MPDETVPVAANESLASPPRESVKMREAEERPEEQSPAERTFATRATRLKLTDTEHDELSRMLDQILDAIQREREEGEWDANWDLWEDLYFGVLQDRPAGQANVHVPLSQEVVDTSLAVAEQVLFTARPWLQVMPREPMDVDQARRKEQHLDYALTVEMQAKEKLESVLWEAGALGTGVSYEPWLREIDRIRDEEVYDGQSVADMERFITRYPKADEDHPDITAKLRRGEKVTLTVEYNESRQDAPELTYIPLRDWLVRASAKWHKLHRERFVGHRFPLRFADIEEQIDDGYYDQRLGRLAFIWDKATGEQRDDPTFRDKAYEVSTGVVRWKRPGDERERRYLVDFHRDSRTILRALHFPYWHNRPNYVPWYFQRSRRYIYGVSLIQKVEHPQFEVNAAHSLTLDAVAFGAIPMFKARKGTEATFNPIRDGMSAGKVWYFDNPDSDAQMFQTGINASVQVLLRLEEMATRHGELASGAMQNLSGLESSRDPDAPATKTIHQTQQALMRIGKYLATLSWSLSEIGFQTSELYYQFSPKGRVFRVVGPEGTPVFSQISRQELRLRADFWPHGTTSALNPEREKRETFQAVEMLMKAQEIAESPLRRLALIEMSLDVLGSSWSQKKHKVLPSADEMEVLRREDELKLKQRQQQLDAAEQPGGAAPPTPGGNGAMNPNRLPPQLAALLGGQPPVGGAGGMVPETGGMPQ